MNFLAHALLAGDAAADRVGGLMGDFIKGPLPSHLPRDLASGVALHRAIDSFAERHDAFIRSRRRIGATRRRLAGVLVDLFYDHLLAQAWQDYSALPLHTYAGGLYTLLHDHRDALPEKGRDVDAVGQAIDRMSTHRIRRANPLAGGIEEYLADPQGFRDDFDAFMPDAIAFAAAWRSERAATD